MEFGLGIEIRLYFSKQAFTTSKHTAGRLSRCVVLFDFFIKSTCILQVRMLLYKAYGLYGDCAPVFVRFFRWDR